MNFTKLSDENLSGLGFLTHSLSYIIETRAATLNAMADVCEKKGALCGVKVVMSRPTPELATVTMTTPFGIARSINGWKIENSMLYGTVTFERKCIDAYGKPYWEPIWGLMIGSNEAARSGHSDNAVVIPLNSTFKDDTSQPCLLALYAILFGVINGSEDREQI